MSEVIRIAMWSGPRNISTAMMRSFSSRKDCAVSDEPFYGAFLKVTGAIHPMAKEIVTAMDCDWQSVLKALNGPAPDSKPVWYQKHMPHHMEGPVSIRDMPHHTHAFLIRAPERVVASYRRKNALDDPAALGFARIREYFEFEADRLGKAPAVVDSDAILQNPRGVLGALCDNLRIDWDEAMLHWPKGPHKADGIWAPHWYDKLFASSGFGPPAERLLVLDSEAQRIADLCREDYEAMREFALALPQG